MTKNFTRTQTLPKILIQQQKKIQTKVHAVSLFLNKKLLRHKIKKKILIKLN